MQLDHALKPISYNVPNSLFHNFLFPRCIIAMANITLTLIYTINTDDLSQSSLCITLLRKNPKLLKMCELHMPTCLK